MNKKFLYSDNAKRFHTFNFEMRRLFGKKAVKISLNGGFTCPNKDGTKGIGGCTYCSEAGSGDFGGNPNEPLEVQFEKVRGGLKSKWGDNVVYIAYFQANTGTYAPLERLKQLYEAALALENIVGLSVSTRPDCITDETADYLAELAKRTFLTVELGLQTVHDSTAELINRCHTYADFKAGYEKLRRRGINVCVHIIDGLPNETREMMLETARELARLKPYAIKIHLLHIISGTAVARDYLNGKIAAMSREEYIFTVCDQLELLPPETVIERLTGDGDRKTLLAPKWSTDKKSVLNGIDKELERRNSYQGSLWSDNL